MAITLGSSTISGVEVGGLPANNVVNANLASGAVTRAKVAGSSHIVLQTVISTYTSAWASSAYSANTWFDLPLSVTITPTKSTSRILLMLTNGNSYIGNGGPYRMLRNGSIMIQADASGSRPRGMWRTATPYGTDQNHGAGNNYTYIDSPGTTSSITYTLQAYNERNVATAYINASGSGYNNSNGGAFYCRTASNWIAMEIA